MKHVQKRSRDTQERILATAKKLFKDEGFEQTSTERIAKQAGVAKGSVFAHFGDKTNLLAAIGSEQLAQLLNRPQPADDLPSLAQTLMRFYQPWLTFFLENPDFTRLYLSQSGLSKGAWTDTFVRACFEQENAVIDIIARSGFRSIDARHPAKFYGSGAQAFFFQMVSYRINGWIDSDRDAENTLRDYLDTWLHQDGS